MGVSSWRIYCSDEAAAQQSEQVPQPQLRPRPEPRSSSPVRPGFARAASSAQGHLGDQVPDALSSSEPGCRLQLPAPLVALPRLPKITPGGPLDAAQKEELSALQQQIQVQLRQQRLLVDSIRQLPQQPNGDSSSSSTNVPSGIAETAERMLQSLIEQDEVIEKIRAGKHIVGPHPAGDLPALDPEADEVMPREAKGELLTAEASAREDTARSETRLVLTSDVEDATCAKTRLAPTSVDKEPGLALGLGSTRKVFVDLNTSSGAVSSGVWPSWGRRFSHGPELTDLPSELGEEAGSGEPGLCPPPIEAKASAPVVPPAVGSSSACVASASCSSRETTEGEPAKERYSFQTMIPALRGETVDADERLIGTAAPSKEERRWIEAALRKMFRSLGPPALEHIIGECREWKLPPSATIVKQGAPVNTGPGLCVLFTGVVDVLYCPKGSRENEKVCTYDRCGQCFGEIELFFDSPKQLGSGRKSHWATIATRTPVTLWTISRHVLRSCVPGAASGASGSAPGTPSGAASSAAPGASPGGELSAVPQAAPALLLPSGTPAAESSPLTEADSQTGLLLTDPMMAFVQTKLHV